MDSQKFNALLTTKKGVLDFNVHSILVLFLVCVITIFASCSDPVVPEAKPEFTIILDPRLEIDDNEYPRLRLDRNRMQTIHRISGQILQNGDIPDVRHKVGWESSHYWALSDTIGFIVRRVINFEGVWTNVDTLFISGFEGELVPTVNSVSISSESGEINTVIAPIYPMAGDTMTIRVFARIEDQELQNWLHIILD